MQFFRRLAQQLHDLVTQPAEQLTRFQRSVRYGIQLVKLCARQMYDDRALELASSLSFRTIFSLLPVALITVLVATAFLDYEATKETFRDYVFDYLNLELALPEVPAEVSPESGPVGLETSSAPAAEAVLTNPSSPNTEALRSSQGTSASAEEELRATISSKIEELLDNARDLSHTGVGFIGIIVLIWSALALVISLEDAFNLIYDCPRGRSWIRRISMYWTILTLGPLLLTVSLRWAGQVVDAADSVSVVGPMLGWLSNFAAMAASWLLLLMLYLWMPNTSVQFRPALIGSFVAAAAWELSKWGFQLYVQTAVSYSALYGSLGLLPLFLYWVYLTWVMVLFGLELTYALQYLRTHRARQERLAHQGRSVHDPQWLIPVLAAIAEAFMEGGHTTTSTIAHRLRLSSASVAELVTLLQEANLVRSLAYDSDDDMAAADEAHLTLARPAETIRLRHVLDLGHKLSKTSETGYPGRPFLRELCHAEMEVAGDRTLADLVAMAKDQ